LTAGFRGKCALGPTFGHSRTVRPLQNAPRIVSIILSLTSTPATASPTRAPTTPLKYMATTYRFRLVVSDSAGVMNKVCGFLVVP
jgi:hypothetical protein